MYQSGCAWTCLVLCEAFSQAYRMPNIYWRIWGDENHWVTRPLPSVFHIVFISHFHEYLSARPPASHGYSLTVASCLAFQLPDQVVLSQIHFVGTFSWKIFQKRYVLYTDQLEPLETEAATHSRSRGQVSIISSFPESIKVPGVDS